MKKNKIFFIVVLDSVIILSVILIIVMSHYSYHPPKIHGIYIAKPKTLTDFHLMDNQGHVFTKNQLLGHWTLLFFGFTSCQSVCPTTMATLNKTYELLQQKIPPHLLPHVVFVSIDPEEDTIKKINTFVNLFNKHFIGVRGETEETLALEKQLSISTKRINNTINHSAEILLVNPEGRAQVYFPYPANPIQLAHDYELIASRQ